MTEDLDLDFQALLPQPFKLKARDGTRWQASPDLMGDEAMYFIRNRNNLQGLEAAEKCVSTFLRSLRVHHPKLTEKEMLEHFTLAEVIQSVMRFLSRAGLGAFSSPTTAATRKPKVRRR